MLDLLAGFRILESHPPDRRQFLLARIDDGDCDQVVPPPGHRELFGKIRRLKIRDQKDDRPPMEHAIEIIERVAGLAFGGAGRCCPGFIDALATSRPCSSASRASSILA